MSLEYPVLIEPLDADEGGGFLAIVPDLPGCMSDGETPEEAISNVQDAIVEWTNAARIRDVLLQRMEKQAPKVIA